MKRTHSVITAAYALVPLLLVASAARAEVEIDWGAYIENDTRAAVHRVDEPAINRNQTSLGFSLKASLLPDKLRFVGDIEFAWTGFTQDTEFQGLTHRETVSPYYVESGAAYLEIYELLPGLDVRIGRQVVQWGTADVFNPTNNLNSPDMEDPLKLGELQANEMIRFDWNPGASDFIVTAVWVPVFQPAALPSSALLAAGDIESMFPYVSPSVRREAERVRNIYLRNLDYYDVYDPELTVNVPDFSLANSQVGLRVQWMVGMFDMSLSYYRGRDAFPVPVSSYSTAERTGEYADDGTPILGVGTDVQLVYPKKQVIGFDLAGQIPFLDDAGFWIEGAVTFPEPIEMSFDITEVAAGAKVIEGYVVTDEPYYKATIGADYSINEYLFVNAQFMRGFLDEFGSYAIHNYWIGNMDIKLLQERVLIRLSAIGELPHEDDDLDLDDDEDGRSSPSPPAPPTTAPSPPWSSCPPSSSSPWTAWR